MSLGFRLNYTCLKSSEISSIGGIHSVDSSNKEGAICAAPPCSQVPRFEQFCTHTRSCVSTPARSRKLSATSPGCRLSRKQAFGVYINLLLLFYLHQQGKNKPGAHHANTRCLTTRGADKEAGGSDLLGWRRAKAAGQVSHTYPLLFL